MIKLINESAQNIRKDHIWIGIGHMFTTFMMILGMNKLLTVMTYYDSSTKYTINIAPAYLMVGLFIIEYIITAPLLRFSILKNMSVKNSFKKIWRYYTIQNEALHTVRMTSLKIIAISVIIFILGMMIKTPLLIWISIISTSIGVILLMYHHKWIEVDTYEHAYTWGTSQYDNNRNNRKVTQFKWQLIYLLITIPSIVVSCITLGLTEIYLFPFRQSLFITIYNKLKR